MLAPATLIGRALVAVASLSFMGLVSAQLAPSPSSLSRASQGLSTTLSLTTSTATIVTSTRSGETFVPVTSLRPTVFNVTVTTTPTSSSASSSVSASTSTSASASSTPDPNKLDTKLDPAFGVLGGLLILTGIPSAFLGHKNRWTSFFLIGFYTLALTCAVLIIRFGALNAVHPPSKTLRGMFVLASTVAGVVGGGIAIFFWKGARFFIGAWGGFVFGLWVQCFRDGGLIGPVGPRYIMYIGCAVVGFVLCTITKIHYYVVIISTALVGATAFMLGVDCFTTQNLKEFYVWNLGFKDLFPRFTSRGVRFPVSQEMQIELGLIAAVALVGIAVQLRILKILQRKLAEIKAESRRRDEWEEARAAERVAQMDLERDEWEKAHPSTMHGHKQSNFSSIMPLMKDQEAPMTPTEGMRSVYSLDDPRQRKRSSLSEFIPSPRPEEELRGVDGRRSQSPGAIPALDLGGGIENNVPATFLAEDGSNAKESDVQEELRRKEALLAEIQEIRKSIVQLKEEPSQSSSSESRRPSLSSRRTLSQDLNSAFVQAPSHLRPPRAQDPRARVQSMELSTFSPRAAPVGEPLSRPVSVPLQEDWDAYVRERKLMQPPSGVTPPIATTPSPGPLVPVSPAVAEALADRQRRESAIELGELPAVRPRRAPTPTLAALESTLHGRKGSPGDEAQPSPTRRQHERAPSGSHAPVTILPPAKLAAPQPRAAMPRTRTYEELEERHREKIRAMQTPLSSAERERAEVEAARARWERSKAAEREAVAKRQAERTAAVAREGRQSDDAMRRQGTGTEGRHSRSLSADKLAALEGRGSSSRRMSTMKVEDWQQRQHQEPPRDTRRHSRSPVTFPDPAKARRRSATLRDPPS